MNERQQRFAEEYIVDYNGTKAAQRAGYSGKTAYAQASHLLKNTEVRAAIKKNLAELRERTFITADRVILEIAKMAFTNISDIISWDADGNVTIALPEKLTAEQRSAISEMSKFTVSIPTKDGSITKTSLKLKMHSKGDALEKLARHLDLLKPNNLVGDITITVKHEQLPGDAPGAVTAASLTGAPAGPTTDPSTAPTEPTDGNPA